VGEWERVKALLSSWVGYTEKDSSKNIQLKTKSSGSGNYTIFGAVLRFLFPELGDTFDVNYAWCLQEQIAGDVIALGLERAKEVLPAITAYTPTMAQAFKNKGWWGTEPKEGAYIFFANPAKASADRKDGVYHVGRVTHFDVKRVYTNEGNTSTASGVEANGGCVAEKSYSRDDPKIYGYGYPQYGTGAVNELAELHPFAREAWVEALWLDILYREPTEEEMATNLKYSALGLLLKLHTSEEGGRVWITNCYGQILDRKPREDEIETWLKIMKQGMTRKEIRRKIKKSPEARTKAKKKEGT
jgi:hypothetical protein